MPSNKLKRAASRFTHLGKFNVNFSSSWFIFRDKSSPSLTILVSLWLFIISLVFFYLSKLLLSGFLQFKGNFARGENNSKYRD